MTSMRAKAHLHLADAHLSLADARSLSPGRLSANDKKALLSVLRPEHVTDPATLDHLGITSDELKRAAESRDGLVDKVGRRLVDLARDELFSPHDFDIANFAVGEHAGVGVTIKTRLIGSNDPLIRDDRFRNDRAGGDTLWISTGAGIYPKANFGGSIPIGPASLSFGFSADASIGVSLLAPYDLELSAAVEAAKKTTTKLALDSTRAREMATGTDMVLRGKGRVLARAGVGAGAELANIGSVASVGARVGVDTVISGELDLSVRTKRLDGDLVYVSISEVDTERASVSAGAHVGVDARLQEEFSDLGGGLVSAAADAGLKAVDKQIEKWLKADIRAVHERSTTEREVKSYILDLSQPKAQQAYDDLMKLDTRAVEKLAEVGDNQTIGGRPLSGATYAKLDEHIRSKSNRLQGSFGPITLLSAVSKQQVRGGTLESGEGTIRYDRARLDDGYFGIFSHLWRGDRDVTRELVTVTRNGGDPESHYRLKYSVEGDRITSRQDVRRFLMLALHLGALDGRTDLLTNRRFLKSFGRTDRNVDVFFTPEGLDRLADATSDDIGTAFGQAWANIERPRKGRGEWANFAAPWMAKDLPDYGRVMALLADGPSARQGGPRGNRRDDNSDDYRRITGRSLRQDAAAFEDLQSFTKLIAALKDAPSGRERAEVFARADGELGLDFFTQLAAAATIVGREDTLVHDLSIEDRRNDRNFVFASEDAIQDIDVEVRRAINAPS